jgi:hypothetical protein
MIEKACEKCGKLFMAYPSNIKRGHAKTCSFSCGTALRKRRQREAVPQLERFLAGANIPEAIEADGCWEWKGKPRTGGYGFFAYRLPGQDEIHEIRAHRASWLLHNEGLIPPGMFVCHSCDNRRCVNPSHLFLGTHQDNMTDMARKGRHADQKGSRNPRVKLSPEQVAYIRSDESRQHSSPMLAKRFGVGLSAIQRVRNGNSWKQPV